MIRRRRKEPEPAKKPEPATKRKSGGNHNVHGGYSLVSKHLAGILDMRTTDGRMLKAFRLGMLQDLGGEENISTAQLALLDRAEEILIVLKKMSEHVAREGVMEKGYVTKNKKGETVEIVGVDVQRCLRGSFLAYSNSFRRILESMRDMMPERIPIKPNVQISVRLSDEPEHLAGVLGILLGCGAFKQELIEMKKVGKNEDGQQQNGWEEA